jgi:hypothetical protein
VEQILDEDIIKGLKKLKFSLWNKLLQKTPLSDCDRKAFLKNPQYIAAGQRATQRGSSQNVWNFQEDKIFHLYQAVNGLLTALPAIQAMQTAKEESGIERVKTVFNGLDRDTREAVEVVLNLVRYTDFIERIRLYQAVNGLLTALPAIQAMQTAEEESGIERVETVFNGLDRDTREAVEVVLNLVRYTDFIERIRNASDLTNKGSGGGALSKLLTLIPATSLRYRAIAMCRDNPNSLDLENRGVEDPQWLDGIRQVAAWAAVLSISTIQNTVGRLRALARSNDHTQ